MDAFEFAVTRLQDRLISVAVLAAVLAAAFDTFEQIRVCALAWQDQAGPAFATWAMTSAEATAGRNALAAAPSLPLTGDRTSAAVPAAGEDAAAAALGGLAMLVRDCLAAAVHGARGGDQAACDLGVDHAARIAALLAGAG